MSTLAAPPPPNGHQAHRIRVDKEGRAFIVAPDGLTRIYLDVHVEQGEGDPLHMFVDTYACDQPGCSAQSTDEDMNYDDDGNNLCRWHYEPWRKAPKPKPTPPTPPPAPMPPPDLCKICGMDFLGDLAAQRILYNGLPHHKACAKTARAREFK